MLEALVNFGFFFGKVIILVIAFIIVVSFIASLIIKEKKTSGKWKITNLNESLKKSKDAILEKVLSKKDLKAHLKSKKKDKGPKKTKNPKKNVYVLSFNGDIKASAAESLAEEINQIIMIYKKGDQVVLKLESPGGMVSGYGLAASQLVRLKEKNIPLTVCIDKVAASGGYLMACVADQIVSAPFAMIGSIGVVAQVPNIHKLLKKNDIDVELHTAGEFKRTLTMLGENTDEAREKFRGQLEEIHTLFKGFVKKFRPKLDIQKVATGEYWFGADAIQFDLVDEIKTSDDLILDLVDTHNVYSLQKQEKQKLADKLSEAVSVVKDQAFKVRPF